MSAVISVCGSMTFIARMEELRTHLEASGHRVYLPEAEEAGQAVIRPPGETVIAKKGFIDAHLEKIRKSDAILVANFPKHGIDGYVGPNTLIEIAFAYALGKGIYLLARPGEQPCKDEVDALGLEVLDGDVANLDPGRKNG